MNIQDIIEAAPRRTVYNDCSDRSMARLDYDKCALCEDAYKCQRRFIATFDPEHVALMEAVCGAAEEAIAGVETEIAEFNADAPCEMRIENVEWDNTAMTLDLSHFINLRIVCIALQAYRKERGL